MKNKNDKNDKKVLIYKEMIVDNKIKYVLSELPKIELCDGASEDMIDEIFNNNKKTKKR